MYPRNAANPERIAIGVVVQISDGVIQTSGVAVKVIPFGGSEAIGSGSIDYSVDGVVLYTPTQAETNVTSFILVASKASCFPASFTVVTTASTTSGKVSVNSIDANAINAASIATSALNGKGDWMQTYTQPTGFLTASFPSVVPNASQVAAAVDVALINTGDGADLLQAIANQIAADWVAGDASPLAVVSALTANSTFIQLVADAASAKNTANTINTKIGLPSVSIAADIATRSTLSTSDIDARLNAYDAPTNAEMVAAFTQIKGATWNASTDTLEAIRDASGATGDATSANQVIMIDKLDDLIASLAEVPKVDEPLTYSDIDESYVVTISR